MTIRIRTLAGPDELESFGRCWALAFGMQYTPTIVDDFARVAEYDRMLVAEDGREVVGTGAAHSFQLSVPGGASTATAGLRALATRPTHRRRGVLTQLVDAMLGEAHRRGEPLASLWASEAGIYRRFGFGHSESLLHWELPSKAPFVPGVGMAASAIPRGDGVTLVDTEPPLAVVAPIYERARSGRPGMIARSPAWWDRRIVMGELGRSTWVLVGNDAYAAYHVERRWGERGPANRVIVQEAVATTPAAEAAMWRFLLDLDLATAVSAGHRPPDDAVVSMVADVRTMARRLSDGLWVRIIDVASALEARSYGPDGSVRLAVTDRLCPWNAGTWDVEIAGGKCSCQPTTQVPDLALDIADLSAVLLGGALAPLGAAGLITEHRPGALSAAHGLFSWPVAPWGVFYY